MKPGVPWSVKGIRPETRETAKEAARRSGLSLGEWLNTVIINQAVQDGVEPHADDSYGDELSSVHERLDDLSRRIDRFTRSGPGAYAPRHARGESNQIAELIGRLDRRLDQLTGAARPMAPPHAPPLAPAGHWTAGIDQAVAEISARQRALNGGPAVSAPAQAPTPAAPLPSQDLSGLEDQLRQITQQIETLRQPGVEEAIDALRGELGEIARSLADAMPQRAIDVIEKQIGGLSQRIAEGRQAGVDGATLSGIEHGLTEVRDALRGLTPAENLIGFNEAVSGLAQKIDLIVAQKDPATLQQLENAITTLRSMSNHVASNETVNALAGEVQALAAKIEHIAMSGPGMDALNHLEHRIAALAEALNERTQSGGVVPPRLEALVGSLADKIEQIQMSRGDSVAVGHLEDRIVKLVEKLDASDSRLGHLETIERGLADLLVHIEGQGSGGLRAGASGGVDALKQDIARTQDALDAVHGTLGLMVDRLATIENDIRGERAPSAADPDRMALPHPVGRVAARLVSDEPPPAAAMPPEPPASAPTPAPLPMPPQAAAPQPVPAPPPSRRASVKPPPIDPDLPPDQPLEPGSGPPHLRASASARIAASEAALGGAAPASAGGKSGFIAAARRAAHAAVADPSPRPARAFDDNAGGETPSFRSRLAQKIKTLFVAASMIAVVVGSIQIAANVFSFGLSGGQTAQNDATGKPAAEEAATDRGDVKDDSKDMPVNTIASRPVTVPAYIAAPGGFDISSMLPPLRLPGPQPDPQSVLAPPGLSFNDDDVTGSIARQVEARHPQAAAPVPAQPPLPIAIGSAALRTAASNGDGPAAYEIAVRFSEGRGVPGNMQEAARWFERAAAQGLAPAQFRLANQFEKGIGIRKDLNQARRLYLAAAGKGNAKAMHNLAVLYAEGIDGKPDYVHAAQWFRKAARRGVSDSQYNLAILLARGLGVEANLAESYTWFALAAAQGDREAGRKRDEVAARLGADALAAGKEAVKSFTAEPQPADAINVPEPPGGWDHAATDPPAVKTRPHSAGTFEVGKR